MSQSPDFAAAMKDKPAQPDPEPQDFQAAMTPKKRGRPPTAPPVTKYSIYSEKPYLSNDISLNVIDNTQEITDINLKDQLTKQELTFLDALFNTPRKAWKDRITIDKAMLAAGYGDLPQYLRYQIAQRITKKYERGAGGAAQVFQDIGFGAVKVAQGIADKAENAESEAVSMQALTLAARCLGMTEPNEAGRSTGVQIIINTGPAPGPAPGIAGPGSALIINADGSTAGAPAIPRKPLQITR